MLNETTDITDISMPHRTAGHRPPQPRMAVRLHALRRARRDAQIRAIRVRRILLTR